MKPVRFDYERPRDIASALTLSGNESAAVKILAGGQSLGPMLNMRLVQPDLVVDITGIADLKRADIENGALVLGACITHADIEDARVPDVTKGAMQRIASAIAYRAVRNRGTIGGSLTHADPAADWVSALIGLKASVVLRSAQDARVIAVEDYMLGALETDLRHGEMLEAVRIPAFSPSVRFGYYKATRKTGEFAHAIGTILHDPARGLCRAVIGAINAKPLLIADARPLFGDSDDLSKFDSRVADTLLQQAGLTDAIEKKIHIAALRRAVERARAA